MNALRMTEALPQLLHQGITGGGAELLLKESVNRRMVLSGNGFVVEQGRERGGAVRVVLDDGRCGLSVIAAPHARQLPPQLEQTLALARLATPDPHLSLPGPRGEQQGRPPYRPWEGPAPVLPAPEAAEGLLHRLLGEGRRLTPAGTSIQQVWIRQGALVTQLANSYGLTGHHTQQLTAIGLLLTGDPSSAGPLVHELFTTTDQPETEPILHAALARAEALFGARRVDGVPGQTLVLAPEASAVLLAAIGMQFVPTAGEHRLPAPGTAVAREGITIWDNGRHPHSPAVAPLDGEGMPTAATVLVRDGLLVTEVHDRRSASLAGTRSTGNAVRHSYRQWPAPGLTTLGIHPHPDLDEAALLEDIDQGFYAVDATPPDPDRLEAGIVSLLLRGRLIRHGRLQAPAAPLPLRLPLKRLLPAIAAAAGVPRLVQEGNICVETPAMRLEITAFNR